MSTDTAVNPVPIAALWMIGTILSLSLMAICGRELGAYMSPFVILFFRSLFGLLIMIPIVLYQYKRIPVTKMNGTHLLRNIFHYSGQYAWFYAVAMLPLATVFAIDFTAPMWTVVLATLMLGEKITKWRIISLLMGFVGVLIVLRPGIEIVQVASLAVLASSFCFALTYTYTSRLTRFESPIIILFYMTAFQLPLSILPALGTWTMPEGTAWLLLIVVGIASITAHYCLSRGLAIADASVVIPFDFMRLPFIVLLGYLLYQEPLDWFVLLGAGIIFTGNMINLRKEYQARENERGKTV
jgi:drug/metabolite transporter (DMT)-like permease